MVNFCILQRQLSVMLSDVQLIMPVLLATDRR